MEHHHRDYTGAINALNSLQTNAALLSELRLTRGHLNTRSLPEVREYIRRAGFDSDVTNGRSVNAEESVQSVIHVTGTKGKGSTCAFTESILRHSGYTTGLFTSPHLVETRERIRINGEPVSKALFAEHFWLLWDAFGDKHSTTSDDAMLYGIPERPGFFRFTFILALSIFRAMRVDVAVMEAGLGGTYDATNVFTNPVVTGVSTLGVDHVNVLGSTVEEIAVHKGGIYKEGVLALCAPGQSASGLGILADRAMERGAAPLCVVPPLSEYPSILSAQLGIPGLHQRTNAALAVWLAASWISWRRGHDPFTKFSVCAKIVQGKSHRVLPAFNIDDFGAFRQGLEQCRWPGRGQTLWAQPINSIDSGIHRGKVVHDVTNNDKLMQKDCVKFFLDGAHTAESMSACVDWFTAEVLAADSACIAAGMDLPLRILIFNCSFDRNVSTLLSPLCSVRSKSGRSIFDCVIFCPMKVTMNVSSSDDARNFTVDDSTDDKRPLENIAEWLRLQSNYTRNDAEVMHFPCIADAVGNVLKQSASSSLLTSKDLKKERPVHVLVTGSLHLVGGTLRVLGWSK